MRTISAAIDPAAISKVSRFFDASDRQIIDEMLQNARRAGATRVDVEIADDQVTMTDDGRGIADPQTLLAFGKSGWNQGVRSSEDPAGMGFFSLARRNAAVDSRPAGGDAWRTDLEPDHFTGRKPAQVHPEADAPAPHGTRVTFSRRRHERDIAGEIANAAIHCPLAVTVDGKSVEHEDFLQHAVRISEYEDVRIGVFHGADKRDPKARSFPNIGRINFHGLAVACPELPKVVPVSERGGGIAKAWSTAVDVKDCPQLELVLPTRHKAVDNEFLHTLAGACRRAIYHAIVEDGRDIRLACVDQLEALVDEIPMPEPPAQLTPWEPASREEEYTGANWSATGTRSVYGPGDRTPLVMDACPRVRDRTGRRPRPRARRDARPRVRADLRVHRLRLVRGTRPDHRHQRDRHQGRQHREAARQRARRRRRPRGRDRPRGADHGDAAPSPTAARERSATSSCRPTSRSPGTIPTATTTSGSC